MVIELPRFLLTHKLLLLLLFNLELRVVWCSARLMNPKQRSIISFLFEELVIGKLHLAKIVLVTFLCCRSTLLKERQEHM